MSEPRRPYVLEMLIPLVIEVEAVDADDARAFQRQFRLSLMGSGLISNYSVGFPEVMRVTEKVDQGAESPQ